MQKVLVSEEAKKLPTWVLTTDSNFSTSLAHSVPTPIVAKAYLAYNFWPLSFPRRITGWRIKFIGNEKKKQSSMAKQTF